MLKKNTISLKVRRHAIDFAEPAHDNCVFINEKSVCARHAIDFAEPAHDNCVVINEKSVCAETLCVGFFFS